ncbi:Glycoside hydrolase family 13 protein [Mycena kentingensis (nom. inval.)]|nr:Glycoside hydrolase family 13 protein [Mycena kentingensis (nom. inval.)]
MFGCRNAPNSMLIASESRNSTCGDASKPTTPTRTLTPQGQNASSSTTNMHPSTTTAWWKDAVVYQIYPNSFADSNGDGFGDIQGIIGKLDYLKDLGVDVVWLSPIFMSPFADMGYDVSDFRDVDPRYGTLEDYDQLVRGLHSRGMKLMMDLVVNHTSDEHTWFQDSKSSKSSEKRDWYIWRPARYDASGQRQPPNNWRSAFQGSAWQYDDTTGEYYLHVFLSKQPDLNWENPQVRQAMHSIMKYWINRGCDGFRIDVMSYISKAEGLPDAPITAPEEEFQDASALYLNGPHVHEYLQEMKREIFSQHNLITVGDACFFALDSDPAAVAQYVLPANRELDMVFQFELFSLDAAQPLGDTDRFISRSWALPEFKKIVERWQTLQSENGYWNTVFMENHDNGRSVSRWGNDSPLWRNLSAKMLAIFQATLGGTQFIYQGQEIGMCNFPATWGVQEYRDVEARNWFNEILEKRQAEQGRQNVDMLDVVLVLQRKARDHARIPIQWDDSPNGGFTTGTPWMRVDDEDRTWSAAAQLADPQSVLAFWKAALRLRKVYKIFAHGTFELLDADHKNIFAYRRVHPDGSRAVVLLNFGTEVVKFDAQGKLDDAQRAALKMVFGNYSLDSAVMGKEVELAGYEGRVYVDSTVEV